MDLENVDMNTKQMVYLLLQHEYLKMLNLDNLSEEEILKNSHEIFPNDWFLTYSLDKQIECISEAIKQKKKINELDIESVRK